MRFPPFLHNRLWPAIHWTPSLQIRRINVCFLQSLWTSLLFCVQLQSFYQLDVIHRHRMSLVNQSTLLHQTLNLLYIRLLCLYPPWRSLTLLEVRFQRRLPDIESALDPQYMIKIVIQIDILTINLYSRILRVNIHRIDRSWAVIHRIKPLRKAIRMIVLLNINHHRIGLLHWNILPSRREIIMIRPNRYTWSIWEIVDIDSTPNNLRRWVTIDMLLPTSTSRSTSTWG